jgi:hypothetical protein
MVSSMAPILHHVEQTMMLMGVVEYWQMKNAKCKMQNVVCWPDGLAGALVQKIP